MDVEAERIRLEAERIIREALKSEIEGDGGQYLRAYVYLMYRTMQMIEEKLKTQEFANKKLIKTLNETNKLLKKLNTEIDKIRKSQQNLESYFHMIVRKEVVP